MDSRFFHADKSDNNFINIPLEVAGINKQAVRANYKNKINGSFGQSLVIFHDQILSDFNHLKEFQNFLTTKLGDAKPDSIMQCYRDQNNEKAKSTAFVPIQNLHTTLIAMRVVDVINEMRWNEQLRKNDETALQLQGRNVSSNNIDILYPVEIKNVIVSLIREIGSIHLKPELISLNANGSLSLVWQPDENLVKLRVELKKIGGVKRGGDDIITTSLGYFPFYSVENETEIISVIKMGICELESNLTKMISDFNLDLDKARLVKFARNDLSSECIHDVAFLENDSVTDAFDDTTFPSNLSVLNSKKSSLALK